MFEAIGSWFLFGTFMYWSVSVGSIILLFYFVEHENTIGAFIEIVVYLFFLQKIAGIDAIGHMSQNRLWGLLYIVGYFIAGTIWSFIKWWIYLRKKVRRFKTDRLKIANDNREDRSSPPYTSWEEIPEDFRENVKNSCRNRLRIPKASENKNKITNWILCWPVSLLWSLFDDIAKEIGRKIVETLNKLYQGMAERAFKEIKEDI